MTEHDLPIRMRECPVCAAPDAYVETLSHDADYYVECVNCRVYRASRRAFRLFQYLRGKADRESLRRLDRLAAALRERPRGQTSYLEYDTWETAFEGY